MQGMGQSMRPPSRHKDPPQNLGLDLPADDIPYLDDDSEDSFGFEIGIDKANNKKKTKQEASEDSFDRNSSDGFQMTEDFNGNAFL